MFDQLIESSNTRIKTRKPLSLTVAVIIHAAVVGLLIVVPMLFPQTLANPLGKIVDMVLMPPPPPPAPLKGGVSQATRPVLVASNQLQSPVVIPPGVRQIIDTTPDLDPGQISALDGVVGGDPRGDKNGELGGVLGGDINSTLRMPKPSHPAPTRAEPKISHMPVGGDVQAAKLLFRQMPIYSQTARVAHIQGSVVLYAYISPEGRIEELRAMSGHPLLVQAAMDAVKKWRYRPTLLNGVPTGVETTITVNFSFNNG